MPITIASIDTIPIMQADESFVDEQFATLNIIFNGKVVAAPRVHLSDLPEGVEVGHVLQSIIAE